MSYSYDEVLKPVRVGTETIPNRPFTENGEGMRLLEKIFTTVSRIEKELEVKINEL